jgi:hypothetical protein
MNRSSKTVNKAIVDPSWKSAARIDRQRLIIHRTGTGCNQLAFEIDRAGVALSLRAASDSELVYYAVDRNCAKADRLIRDLV